MLAISAARMRTASSPSRNTIIALFVTIETREPGPLPIRCSASASAASSAARVAASSRRGRLALDQPHEPVPFAVAVPEQRLDALEERRREPAEALLGAELEDAVRLDPGRLRDSPVAARGSGLHPVERRGDDVEVRRLRGVLPLRRIERLQVARPPIDGRRVDGVRSATAVRRDWRPRASSPRLASAP